MIMPPAENLQIYTAAFDLLPDTIFFIKSPQRDYLLANQGLARMCCVDHADDVIGKTSSDFFEPTYATWCHDLDSDVLDGRHFENRLDCLTTPQGEQVWTRYSRRPLDQAFDQRVILSVSQVLPSSETLAQLYATLRNVSEAIEHNLDRRWTTENIADLAGLSKAQLNRGFKQVFQQSPSAYVDAAKLRLAKFLLAQGHSLADISGQLGFSEQSAFSRFFKRLSNVSPAQYLRALKPV